MYNVTTASYAYRDKYYGRRVKPHEAVDAVEMYFNNGDTVHVDLIPLILEKVYGLLEVLEQLTLNLRMNLIPIHILDSRLKSQVVQNLPRHRFFSTSLLFIYEGDVDAPKRVTVKLIDFAHTMSVDDLSEVLHRDLILSLTLALNPALTLIISLVGRPEGR